MKKTDLLISVNGGGGVIPSISKKKRKMVLGFPESEYNLKSGII